VQQRLMRHADIRTTMNQYGDALTADMQQAQGKVIQLVFKVGLTDRKRIAEFSNLLKEWLLR
jgi:hypothetical protein